MRKDTANRHLVALLLADGFSISRLVWRARSSATTGLSWRDRPGTDSPPAAPVPARFGPNSASARPFSRVGRHGGRPRSWFHPWTSAACPGPDALEELRRAHRRGARIGVTLHRGVHLGRGRAPGRGRTVTTHWDSVARLAETYPSVTVDPSVLYIDDGDILTSAGSAASMDLCLHLVRQDYGADVANVVARQAKGFFPHRDGGQVKLIQEPMPPADDHDALAETLSWVQEHLDEAITVESQAARAAMSPRHVRPPVPGCHGDHAAPVVEPSTGATGPAAPRDDGPECRRGRLATRGLGRPRTSARSSVPSCAPCWPLTDGCFRRSPGTKLPPPRGPPASA